MAIPAVGVYPVLTNATSAGAKTEIIGHIEILRALINARPTAMQAAGQGSTNSLPYFDGVHPYAVEQLAAELDALEASVTGGA